MEARNLRLQRYVCQACRNGLHHPAPPRPARFLRLRPVSASTPRYSSNATRAFSKAIDTSREKAGFVAKNPPPSSKQSSAQLDHAQKLASIIIHHPSVPSDEQTLEALKAIQAAAQHLVDVHDLDTPKPTEDGSPTAAILSLDSRPTRPTPKPQSVDSTIDTLSDLAYQIVTVPQTFLSPEILTVYVAAQALLSRPASFPEVFSLYASKPQPKASKAPGSAIAYDAADPSAVSAGVPSTTATLALAASLHARDLPLALSIIETTYRAPAFRRAKIFRRALPPAAGAVLMPVAAWTMASNLAVMQTGLPPETFAQIAFAGMATYAGAVGTLGYVALASSNDQMRRVTWAVGMPLWERWLREDERAAVDAVACAWGFRESWRWGEEEGREWEDLKEWIGVRGMVLDKVGLMQGME